MKPLTLLMATLCCVTLITLANAQTKRSSRPTKKMTSDDVRIVKNKPHIFIAFAREGKIEPLYVGEGHTRAWLRFYNNSKWKVKFCSGSVPKEYGEIEITYEIERYQGFGKTTGVRSSDTCAYRSLEAGKSVLFSVPREHLAEGVAVKVPFRYEWEFDPDGTDSLLEPKHYTYFYSSDIPKR